MQHPRLKFSLRFVEITCRLAGAGLVLAAAAAFVDALVMSRVALAAFDQPAGEVPAVRSALPAEDAAVAVLKIERLGVEVPVFPGTSRTALRRGAGSIEGTAAPGQQGNIGVAGHRDGFFRPLEGITVGDSIELISRDTVQRFRVHEIRIVDPLDVSVLDAAPQTLLTLVTCYPFRYVGFAPDRYIVHAQLEEELERPACETPEAGPGFGSCV